MSCTPRDKRSFPYTSPLLCSSLLMGSLVKGTFQEHLKRSIPKISKAQLFIKPSAPCAAGTYIYPGNATVGSQRLGFLSLWFIIIYRSGWKLQESRAGGAGEVNTPRSRRVFHTAPLACCSFWSLFTTQAPFQREQSSCSGVIVQLVCCSRITDFLGRVKVRAKHPSVSTHRPTGSQNSPLLLHTLQVPEGIHTCRILLSFLGLSPIFIFMETLLVLPWMGCSGSW